MWRQFTTDDDRRHLISRQELHLTAAGWTSSQARRATLSAHAGAS
jgi:hypothetical protein